MLEAFKKAEGGNQLRGKKMEFNGNEIRYCDKNWLYNQTHKDKIPNYCYAIYEFDSWEFHLAEFKTLEQLERFARRLGFEFTFDGKHGRCSKVISDKILGVADAEDEKPEGAAYLWSLSNGSIVRNWFTEKDGRICIHRINPNNKKFYNPLSLDEHIKFVKENGKY